MDSQSTLKPGPLDPELLFLHNEHRASALFYGAIDDCQLQVRRCDSSFWNLVDDIPEAVMCHIQEAGFGGVIRCGYVKIDHALITALVERWRPETHTFHFPIGEATVTLQDVEVLWGLQVEGDVVSGFDALNGPKDWIECCQYMMGFTPSTEVIRKGQILLRCLYDILRTPLPTDASVEDCIKRARVYILYLLGGCLLSDSSGNSVYMYHLYNLLDLSISGQRSWGSAILACLYRRLCKATSYKATEISGPLVLLQLWAWERLPTICPIRLREEIDFTRPYGARWNCKFRVGQVTTHVLRAYRDQLSSLKPYEFVWTPYSDNVLQALPIYCRRGYASWRCVTYLICWEIVEAHLPNRVLRQFGIDQPIPQIRLLENHNSLHKMTRKGKMNWDWRNEHRQYIDHWHCRLQHVENGLVSSNLTNASFEYMNWYWPRTVIYITNPSGVCQNAEGFQGRGETAEYLVDGLRQIYHRSIDMMGSNSINAHHFGEIRDMSSYYMQQVNADQRIHIRSSHVTTEDSSHNVPLQRVQRLSRNLRGARQGGRRRRSEFNDAHFQNDDNVGPSNSTLAMFTTCETSQLPMTPPYPNVNIPHINQNFEQCYTPQMTESPITPIPFSNLTDLSENNQIDINMSESYAFDLEEDDTTMVEDVHIANRRTRRTIRQPRCGTHGRLGH